MDYTRPHEFLFFSNENLGWKGELLNKLVSNFIYFNFEFTRIPQMINHFSSYAYITNQAIFF